MYLPPVTKALLIALAVAYLAQMLAPEAAILYFALWPLGDYPIGTGVDGLPVTVGFLPWQILSYGLLHGSLGHLFFNALAMLAAASIRALSPSEAPETISGRLALTRASAMLRRVIPQYVEIEISTDGPVPTVLVDIGSVEQVLLNLATNARDAMPGGGTLHLSVEEARIEVPMITEVTAVVATITAEDSEGRQAKQTSIVIVEP